MDGRSDWPGEDVFVFPAHTNRIRLLVPWTTARPQIFVRGGIHSPFIRRSRSIASSGLAHAIHATEQLLIHLFTAVTSS